MKVYFLFLGVFEITIRHIVNEGMENGGKFETERSTEMAVQKNKLMILIYTLFYKKYISFIQLRRKSPLRENGWQL